MTIDLAKLRALAEAVTQPGPWTISKRIGFAPIEYNILDAHGMWFADLGPSPLGDAEYLAAVSPTTVIALLDEIERLSSQRDAWRKDSDGWKSASRVQRDHALRAEAHSGHVENQALVAQLAALTTARNELADKLASRCDPLWPDYEDEMVRIGELRKVGGAL